MSTDLKENGGGESEAPPPNPKQSASLDRFTKKLPRDHGPVIVEIRPGGGQAFVSEVPGRVPGSKAIYRKEVDDAGNTIGYTKTTIDPSGKIVHIKDKFPGGPAGAGGAPGD